MFHRLLALTFFLVAGVSTNGHAALESVIDEVMAGVGTGGSSTVQYIEVRFRAANQHTAGSQFAFFGKCSDPTPNVVVLDALPSDVPDTSVGARWIIATPEFAASAHIAPDFLLMYQGATIRPMVGTSNYDCGMVCWGHPATGLASHADQYTDCVAYGGYHFDAPLVGANPPFAGTETALKPGDGTMSLTRIADAGNNATDFDLRTPSPTNNAGDVGCFAPPCATTTTTTPGATTTTIFGATTTTTLPGGLVRTSVPGGGPAKSDCYVELGVTGTSGIAVVSSHIVSCRDGDASCDTDGVANGACVFSVAVCTNQTNVTGCSSTSLTGPPTVNVIPPSAGTLTPPDGTATACGTSSTITIPLKGKTKNKPNKVKIRVKGKISSGKPKADSDTYILKCTPPAP